MCPKCWERRLKELIKEFGLAEEKEDLLRR